MVQLRFDHISRIYLHPHLQRSAGGVSKDVPDYFTLHVLLERDLQGTPLYLLPTHKALTSTACAHYSILQLLLPLLAILEELLGARELSKGGAERHLPAHGLTLPLLTRIIDASTTLLLRLCLCLQCTFYCLLARLSGADPLLLLYCVTETTACSTYCWRC
jgi:hypothetical protein